MNQICCHLSNKMSCESCFLRPIVVICLQRIRKYLVKQNIVCKLLQESSRLGLPPTHPEVNFNLSPAPHQNFEALVRQLFLTCWVSIHGFPIRPLVEPHLVAPHVCCSHQLGISEETALWGGNLPIYWVLSCHLVVVLTIRSDVSHHTPPLIDHFFNISIFHKNHLTQRFAIKGWFF